VRSGFDGIPFGPFELVGRLNTSSMQPLGHRLEAGVQSAGARRPEAPDSQGQRTDGRYSAYSSSEVGLFKTGEGWNTIIHFPPGQAMHTVSILLLILLRCRVERDAGSEPLSWLAGCWHLERARR
jgi:hypothetical protein